MIQKIMMTILMSAFLFTSTMADAAARNEGITCISKGSTVQALYDKNGSDVRRNIRVGSSYKGGSCMGRCGAACGGWAPSAWAKDCLDHDICIRDQNGSNAGPFDANCGNEFNHAADDYTFGVLRGCRG